MSMAVDTFSRAALAANAVAPISPVAAPPAQNPVYKMFLSVQGIVTRNVEAMAREWSSVLKASGMQLQDVSFSCVNGYGTPLCATIVYTPKIPVNDAVMKQAKHSFVNTQPIWGAPLSGKVLDRVGLLTDVDQIILNVVITSRNGYGTPLSADIVHISKAAYDAAMGNKSVAQA